ncbi:MAG: V-type ATPase subunit [Candidatus Hydrogenedentes bacterium]|nr:V-type ATPase subunit [Candidatus Hydrogenedentota bacterium]
MENTDALAPYMNSRICGMRSRLLPRAEFENLLDLGDAGRVADALLSGPYQQEMAEALTRYHGADAVEDAVTRNLVATFNTLYGLTQGYLRELTQIFLLRWDLIAVKSLLRARRHNLDEATASMGLMPGPSMTVAVQKSFLAHDSMESLIGALASWKPSLCGVLEEALPAYQAANEVTPLEERLDREYFVTSVKTLRAAEDDDAKILRTALQMEIDRINMRTIFQLKDPSLGADALAERLLPHGLLHASTLQNMATARDAQHAAELLSGTAYKEMADRFFMFVQTMRYSPLERLFDSLIIRHLKRESRVHVMSIAVLMHYTWLKYNEVVNLRLIARGEASKLPRGRIREEVVYA